MTLLELFQLLRRHLKLVILLPVISAVVVGIFSFAFMKNTYTATTSMYILMNSSQNSSQSTSYTDLTSSQMIANDVASLLSSDIVISGTAKSLNLENLNAYKTSVSSETTSRLITLSVTGTDAEGAAQVANAMARQVSDVAKDVKMADSINVIDKAATPTAPSGPNRMLYTAVAFLGGLFVAVAVVVLMDMLNTRVRSAEDAEELLGVPVIGRIPAMKQQKGGK